MPCQLNKKVLSFTIEHLSFTDSSQFANVLSILSKAVYGWVTARIPISVRRNGKSDENRWDN
jgi:hypothetical protein